jgi:hypothetical protein
MLDDGVHPNAEANLLQAIFSTFLLHLLSSSSSARVSLGNQNRNRLDAEHQLLLASEMKNVNMRHGCKGAGEVLQMLLLSRTVAVLLQRYKSGVPDLKVRF